MTLASTVKTSCPFVDPQFHLRKFILDMYNVLFLLDPDPVEASFSAIPKFASIK